MKNKNGAIEVKRGTFLEDMSDVVNSSELSEHQKSPWMAGSEEEELTGLRSLQILKQVTTVGRD